MNAEYSAIAELGNISFLSDVLLSPYPIPETKVRRICGWDVEVASIKNLFLGRVNRTSAGYNKNKPLILEFLKGQTYPLPATVIGEMTGLCTESTRIALNQLKLKGLVVSEKSKDPGVKRGTNLWKLMK
ncbi:MAG: hypothetical protein IPK55_14930 [Streptococcus sp.]|nr:hypothetical protein [Streptococcus sp.]